MSRDWTCFVHRCRRNIYSFQSRLSSLLRSYRFSARADATASAICWLRLDRCPLRMERTLLAALRGAKEPAGNARPTHNYVVAGRIVLITEGGQSRILATPTFQDAR